MSAGLPVPRFGVAVLGALVLHGAFLLVLHAGGRPLVVRPVAEASQAPATPPEIEATEVELDRGRSGASGADPVADDVEVPRAIGRPPSPAPLVISPLGTTEVNPPPVAVPGASAAAPAASTGGVGAGPGDRLGIGAGEGSGGGAGTGRGGGDGPRSGADRAAMIRALLERVRATRRYPELARRRELEGVVRVSFSVGADGRPQALRVLRPVDPLLDAAAQEAVERAAPLPLVTGPVEIELDFRLSDE